MPTSSSKGGSSCFFYSVTRDARQGKVFLKLVNASSNPQPVEIQLGGIASVSQTAKLVSLTGAGLASTNTLTDPIRIVPVTSTVKGEPASATPCPDIRSRVLKLSAK